MPTLIAILRTPSSTGVPERQRDGGRSATGRRGTRFAAVGLVVEPPFCSRPMHLPVAALPWRPKAEPSKVGVGDRASEVADDCRAGR